MDQSRSNGMDTDAKFVEKLKFGKGLLNGYALFRCEWSHSFKNSGTSDGTKNRSKLINQVWSKLTMETKRKYNDRASLVNKMRRIEADKKMQQQQQKQHREQLLQQQQQTKMRQLLAASSMSTNTSDMAKRGEEINPIEICPDSPDDVEIIDRPFEQSSSVPQPANCTLLSDQFNGLATLEEVKSAIATEAVPVTNTSPQSGTPPMPVMLLWNGQNDIQQITASVATQPVSTTVTPMSTPNVSDSTANQKQSGVQNVISSLDSFITPELQTADIVRYQAVNEVPVEKSAPQKQGPSVPERSNASRQLLALASQAFQTAQTANTASQQLQTMALMNQTQQLPFKTDATFSPPKDTDEPMPIAIVETTSLVTVPTQTTSKGTTSNSNISQSVTSKSSSRRSTSRVSDAIDLTDVEDESKQRDTGTTSVAPSSSATESPAIGSSHVHPLSIPAPMSNQAGGKLIFGFKQKVPKANGTVASDFLCNFCETAVPEVRDFLAHVLNHIFVCTMCNFQSFQRADVISHVMNRHPELLTNFPHLEAMHMSRGLNVASSGQKENANCLNFIQSISKLLHGEVDIASIPTTPCFPAQEKEAENTTKEPSRTPTAQAKPATKAAAKETEAGSKDGNKAVKSHVVTVLVDSDSEDENNNEVEDLDSDVTIENNDSEERKLLTVAENKNTSEKSPTIERPSADTDELEVIAEERRDTCRFCFYKELHASGKKKGLVGKDTPKLLWGCPYCEQSSETMEVVKAHVAEAHSNKPVDALRRCPVCYARKGKGAMHKEIMAKLKLYQCPFCRRLDKQRNLIIRHINFVHVDKEFNTNELIKVAKPELTYKQLYKHAESSVSMVETVKLEHTELYPKLKHHTFSYDPDLYDDAQSDDDAASIATTTSENHSAKSSVEAKQKSAMSGMDRASNNQAKREVKCSSSGDTHPRNQVNRKSTSEPPKKRHVSDTCEGPPDKKRSSSNENAVNATRPDPKLHQNDGQSTCEQVVKLNDGEFVCSSKSDRFCKLQCKDCDDFVAYSLMMMKSHFVNHHDMKSFLALDPEAHRQRLVSRVFFCCLADCDFVSYGSSFFLQHVEDTHPGVVIPIDILCRYMISQKKKKYSNRLKSFIDQLVTESYDKSINNQTNNPSSNGILYNLITSKNQSSSTAVKTSNTQVSHGLCARKDQTAQVSDSSVNAAKTLIISSQPHQAQSHSSSAVVSTLPSVSVQKVANSTAATSSALNGQMTNGQSSSLVDVAPDTATAATPQIPGQPFYVCVYCSYTSSVLNLVCGHVRREHNKENMVQVVQEHVTYSYGVGSESKLFWLCRWRTCNFITRDKEAYDKHMCNLARISSNIVTSQAQATPVPQIASPTPNKEKLYKCCNCVFESQKANEVRLHLRNEHGKEGLPQRALCTDSDGSKTESWFCRWMNCNQVHHLSNAHLTHLCGDDKEDKGSEMQYKCYYCSYLTVRLSNVRRHLFVTHKDDQVDQIAVDLIKFREGKDGLVWLCPQKLCTFWDTVSTSYDNHKCPLANINEQQTEKKYHCIHCDYAGSCLDDLRGHLRQCHPDPSCEQAYTDSSRLAFGAPSRRWFCIARKCTFVAQSYDQYMSHTCDPVSVPTSSTGRNTASNNLPSTQELIDILSTPSNTQPPYSCFYCKDCSGESLYEIRQHLFAKHVKLRPVVLDMVKVPGSGCPLYLCSKAICAYASYNPRETHMCMASGGYPGTPHSRSGINPAMNNKAATGFVNSPPNNFTNVASFPPRQVGPIGAIRPGPAMYTPVSAVSMAQPINITPAPVVLPINITPSNTQPTSNTNAPSASPAFLTGLLNSTQTQDFHRIDTLSV